MDPGVVQDHPGDCPKCGMALEPVTPVAGPAPEMADFTRRLIVSVSCAVPLMGLSMIAAAAMSLSSVSVSVSVIAKALRLRGV